VAPDGLEVGTKLLSGTMATPEVGNSLPMKNIPAGMTIHNLEITPGKGAQMVRSAGAGAVLMAVDEGHAQVKLPSGEIRRFHEDCYATIGQVGNVDHEKIILGKAGRNRHMGQRPLTRGVARNPVDHPNGGGQGKSKGGGGRQHLVSPWGLLAKGKRTRKKYKLSNRFILVRRDGRTMKNK
jgi:large subunit ribosomal protein L2